MSKTLYLECESGISGDMFVAALLDLGADGEKLKRILATIPVSGAEIVISRVKKSGLDVCDFLVKLDKEHENHDHDTEYLHGHAHSHEHGHPCEHEHSHGHKHPHEHSHGHDHEHEHSHGHDHPHVHAHSHEHRGLPEIMGLLKQSEMSPKALEYTERIFRILAQAEAKAHGVPVDQVHFHEVGAIDSILDIAAAGICLDDLDIGEVYIPELTEGCGTVRCQHGILPIPVPAVANVAAAHGLPIRKSSVRGELITPTGAAIAAALRTEKMLPRNYCIEAIGLGAGKREYETPGFLRAMLIRETRQETVQDRICKLESNIDDCTGEQLGYLMELLLEAGARDVHYIPVFMKKNRPAYEVAVICDEEKVEEMERILFRETTTIGIRRVMMERTILRRSFEKVHTPWGTITVKVCQVPGEKKPRKYPEYNEAKQLAKEHGVPLRDICFYVENIDV